MKSTVLKTTFSLFALLGIVFIPFPFNVFPFQTNITHFLFEDIIHFVAVKLFGLTHNYQEITSDSSSLFILTFLLFGLSLTSAFIISFSKKWKKYEQKTLNLIFFIICYYIALQLFNYGIDKVFKAQFYLPEPNILYTPLGQLDKDILYWSTLGTSYLYNMILGSIEVVTALLLVIRKTRVIGLLMCCGVFINVIAVNFSFDISVKLYSSFLFIITLTSLVPIFKKLYQFFILNRNTRLNRNLDSFHFLKHSFIKPCLKFFILSIIIVEVFYPFVFSGNYNDDKATRPLLHGAYSINDQGPYKRLFIHRQGYLIFQDKNDLMIDFKLTVNDDQLIITDYNLNTQRIDYTYNNEILKLNYFHKGKISQLKCIALNWKELPVLKNNFHWFVDDV